MKTITFLMALSLSSISFATDYDGFIRALNQIEASGQKENVPDGDNGMAIGAFQIHYVYWVDATQHDKSIGGTYNDCRNYNYAVKVVKAYLDRYARKYVLNNNWEACSRIENGGPQGYKKNSTIKYWNKVKKAL